MSELIRDYSRDVATYRLDTIEFRVLTEDKVEGAMRVQRESMRQECIAKGVGIFEESGAEQEMHKGFWEVIKDGMTMIAVDVVTDEVVSVCFNKLRVPSKNGEKDPFDEHVEQNVKHESCLALFSFLEDVESRVDIFERYKVNAAMEIFYVGTLARYQGRHIARHLMEASIDFARGLKSGATRKVPVCKVIVHEDIIPEVVFAVFASNFSQRAGEKLKFDFLAEVQYADYICGSKRLSERIGSVHKTAKLAALKL